MAGGNFGGGIGTTASPFLIEDLADLLKMASMQNTPDFYANSGAKHFRLSNDIDASKSELAKYNKNSWEPINGWSGPASGNYIASIDFNFKAIKNLYIYKPNADYVGFFKTYGDKATVILYKGRFENVDITGKNNVGCVTGDINVGSGHKIDGVYVSGEITGTNYVGGIAGLSTADSLISNCEVDVTLTGSDYVGGVTSQTNGDVSKCIVKGDINGLDYLGGIVGYSPNVGSSVSDCVALLNSITRIGGSGNNIHRICGALNAGSLTNNKAIETMKFRY